MDLGSRDSVSPASSVLQHSSSGTSFPVIAIAIIGILATALLLVSYYIFVIKCCLNWQRSDLLRRFSRNRDDPLMVYAPSVEPRGLDESVIRSIPVFRFQKGTDNRDCLECAVCLGEFVEAEKLRMIPNCSHVFHIDCIDVWLQSNANCPLCRTSISSAPSHWTVSPRLPESSVGRDEDYVVIELRGLVNDDDKTNGSSSPPARRKKWNKVKSMGDECIDSRGSKDEQFQIQPIRRSVSMDSSADRLMFLAVQEMVGHKGGSPTVSSSPMEGGSNSGSGSGRVKRSFFSFGNGSRGSRSSSVLPLYFDPSITQTH